MTTQNFMFELTNPNAYSGYDIAFLFMGAIRKNGTIDSKFLKQMNVKTVQMDNTQFRTLIPSHCQYHNEFTTIEEKQYLIECFSKVKFLDGITEYYVIIDVINKNKGRKDEDK